MISFSLNDSSNKKEEYKQKYPVHYSMDELSKKLNIAKSNLDKPRQENPKGSKFDFAFVTTFFEMSKMLKQTVSRQFNIPKVSNAYLKQYEILSYFPEIINNTKSPIYRYFDNASFPGAFIRATDHYIKDHISEINNFDWFASSLFNEEYGVLGDEYNLLYNYPFRWLMDLPSKEKKQINNGDVSIPSNILDFRRKFLGGVETQGIGFVPLYTSDLGFDVSSDYSKQEQFHLKPNLGQISVALESVEEGGTQITKQFTFFEERNRIILYILTLLYKKVNIIKPITSKPDNSEIYILCIGYNRKSSLKYRELIIHALKYWDKKILEEIKIPDDFNKKLNFIANELYQRQIDKLNFNIDLFYKLKKEMKGNDNRVNLPSYFYKQLKNEVEIWLNQNKMKTINNPIPITKTIITMEVIKKDSEIIILKDSEWNNKNNLSLIDYYDSLNILLIESLRGKTIIYDHSNKDIAELLFKLLINCGYLLRLFLLKTIKKVIKKEVKEEKKSWADISDEEDENKKIEKEYQHWKFIKTIFVPFTEKQMIKSGTFQLEKRKYELVNCLERFLISVYNNLNITDLINKLSSELVEKNIISKDYIDFYKKEVFKFIDNIKSITENKEIDIKEINEIKNMNNIIKYEEFSYDLNILEPERINFLLSKPIKNVLIMLLRYDSCLSAGQQWSCPQYFFNDIYNKYNVRYEGFASPLNTRLIFSGKDTKFCSLFLDTDRIFGSIGNFFTSKNGTNENWLVNPPFVEKLLEEASLTSIEKSKTGTVIFIMPNWTDSNAYKKGKDLIKANFASMIFVLSNNNTDFSNITSKWINNEQKNFISQFSKLEIKENINENKEIFDFNAKLLFPPTQDSKKLKMTTNGLNITPSYAESNYITQLIIKNFQLLGSHTTHITDAFSGIGGNTISFWLSKTFIVQSIENDKLNFEILKNNLNVYKLPIYNVINDNYEKIYKELKQDIVFFDLTSSNIDKINIKIINDLINSNTEIALKVPLNYNLGTIENKNVKVIIDKIVRNGKLTFNLISIFRINL